LIIGHNSVVFYHVFLLQQNFRKFPKRTFGLLVSLASNMVKVRELLFVICL